MNSKEKEKELLLKERAVGESFEAERKFSGGKTKPG